MNHPNYHKCGTASLGAQCNETHLKEPKALPGPVSCSLSHSSHSSVSKESFIQFVFGNGYRQKNKTKKHCYISTRFIMHLIWKSFTKCTWSASKMRLVFTSATRLSNGSPSFYKMSKSFWLYYLEIVDSICWILRFCDRRKEPGIKQTPEYSIELAIFQNYRRFCADSGQVLPLDVIATSFRPKPFSIREHRMWV